MARDPGGGSAARRKARKKTPAAQNPIARQASRDLATQKRQERAVSTQEAQRKEQNPARQAQRAAERRIASQFAADLIAGRIPPHPGGTRHAETADMVLRQVGGYGLAATSAFPGPHSVPLAALSALILSADPSFQKHADEAKKGLERSVSDPSLSLAQRVELASPLALIAGAGNPLGGGKLPKGRRIAPYISKGKDEVGSIPDEAWEKGYLYHRTTPGKLGHIRKFGLQPRKPLAAGEEEAVYFAGDPLRAAFFSAGKGNHVYLRTRRERIPNLEQRAEDPGGRFLGEEFSRAPVGADDLEYLGRDGQWHRLAHTPEKPVGAKEIAEALPEASRTYAAQRAGYRPERAKRATEAARSAEMVGGGEAGFRAARAALRGELPKLEFTRLVKLFNEGDDMAGALKPQVDEHLDYIRAHPALSGREFDIQNTQEALLKALRGESIAKHEIRLLEKVYGEEAAQHFKWKAVYEKAINILNIPRSLRASYDLSAPFRQGLVLGARHPVVFARAWAPMLKAARSERGYRAVMDEIAHRPTFDEMKDSGIKFTDLTGITTREEAFISQYAEKIPIVGRGVRISSRAYTAFLNKLRADVFDLMLDHYPNASKKELHGLASWINAGSGRGGMGFESLERAAPLLTIGFFSPRLIASRLSLLNPAYYAKLPGPARKEALRGMAQLLAAGGALLWLAKEAGAEVVDDPRNADFGKIRVGNTRIDIWGGLQQYVVQASRQVTAEYVSSTTGKTTKLTGDFGEKSQWDIFTDFATGKAAPLPGYIIGQRKGKTSAGEDFNELREAARLFTPLGAENAYEGYSQYGARGALLHAPEFFGFGIQTYGAQPSKKSSSSRGSAERRRSKTKSSGGGSASRRRRKR